MHLLRRLLKCEQPSTVVVDSNTRYNSISKALRDVNPGGTVLIKPGIYNEEIILPEDKGFTLRGDGKPADIVINSPRAYTLRNAHSLVSKRKPLSLRRRVKSLFSRDGTREEDSRRYRFNIENVSLQTDGAFFCVYLFNCPEDMEITFRECEITCNGRTGIAVIDSKASVVVDQCHIHDCRGNGLYVSKNNGSVLMTRSEVEETGWAGVLVCEGSSVDVRHCRIHHCSPFGLWAKLSTQGKISFNCIYDNETRNINNEQSNMEIEHNSHGIPFANHVTNMFDTELI